MNDSLTVSVLYRMSSYITYAILLPISLILLRLTLFTFTVPDTSRLSLTSLPDRKLSNVVFPLPEGPKIAVN